MAEYTMHHLVVGEDTYEIVDETARTTAEAAFATDTASGAIATFSDGADGVPVKSLSVDIEPVQAGSGDPSPTNIREISGWDTVKVTRTGANLANSDNMLLIGSNVTYTEADGYYFPRNFSNISDACAVFVNESKLPMQLSLAYDVKHSGDEGDGSIIRINYTDGTYTRSASSTTPADEWRHVTVTSNPNKVISSVKYPYLRPTRPTWIKNIQLNVGDTASDYESYNGTVYTIDLPQTVYGGTLDVSTGELTVTHGTVDMGTLNWSRYTSSTNPLFRVSVPGQYSSEHPNVYGLCSCYGWYGNGTLSAMGTSMADKQFGFQSTSAYVCVRDDTYSDAASFKTAVSGQLLFYPLAEQQTLTLTPEQVTTLLGQNNIYSDAGEVAVTYRADTGLYIQKVINA